MLASFPGGGALRVPALLLLAALPAPGCALLPLGGNPTAAPGGGRARMGAGLQGFRVAFHCHSHLSHDSDVSFRTITETARLLGFNAVVLTDHYQPGNIARSPRGTMDGVLFIPGVEMRPPRPPGGARAGRSLLVFGLDRDFEPQGDRPELIAELQAGGALVAAGHCEDFQAWGLYPLQAFEVYNLHAQFEAASRWGILWRLLFLLADPFFESHVRPSRSVLDLYDARLAAGDRLAPLAGHDAHANVRLFGRWGPTIGTYPEVLRLFSNHVLAERLEAASLLEGIRRGRVYVSFDFLGDAAGFVMTYGPAIIGGEAPYRPGVPLQVESPLEGRIRVLKDGAPWGEARGRAFSAPPSGPGVYRTEVDRAGAWGEERLWIISAPIRIHEEKEGEA